jgi:hypothetical protein
VFAISDETPCLFSLLSAIWAVGLVIGGPIWSDLASNRHTTARWAFYINLPWVSVSLAVAILCLPRKYLGPDRPLVSRLMAIDPVGVAFNMAAPVLFALALEFSGPVWNWGSGASIPAWVAFGVVLIRWIV